jgi:carbon storage regulator
MLVLARKRGEAIVIGDDITVEIIDVRGDKIRLGITAPKDIRVLRTELLDSKQAKELQPA